MQWLRMASILLLWAGFVARRVLLTQETRWSNGEPFCPRARSVADLRQLAAAFTDEISSAHAAWASKSRVFHEQALNEQLRVAVLVP